jgi:hypothetical protein
VRLRFAGQLADSDVGADDFAVPIEPPLAKRTVNAAALVLDTGVRNDERRRGDALSE